MSRQRSKNSDAGCFSAFTGGLAICLGIVGGSMMGSGEGRDVSAIGGIVCLVSLILFGFSMIALVEHKQSLVSSIRQVDEGAFGNLTIRIRPHLRCPYCRDSVKGETYECAGCKTIYHAECLEEAHGCTTLGCVHAPPRRTVRA